LDADYIISNDRIDNDKLERTWKKTVVAFNGGAEENRRELRIAGVSVEIRTEHLPNTSLERYRYAILSDDLESNSCLL
jgi:hypothetical protein